MTLIYNSKMRKETNQLPIWIIDDDEEMINAISLMLNVIEYKVKSFFNAPSAARSLLAGNVPRAIILDINMPEVSGLDFLEFMRARSEYDKIPVIMLSTESTDIQVDRAINLGANHYIFKPVMIDELENTLASVFVKK